MPLARTTSGIYTKIWGLSFCLFGRHVADCACFPLQASWLASPVDRSLQSTDHKSEAALDAVDIRRRRWPVTIGWTEYHMQCTANQVGWTDYDIQCTANQVE